MTPPNAPTAKRECVIFVDRRPIDVVALYREHGFTELPPTLTISGADLHRLSDTPQHYSICLAAEHSQPIGIFTAIPVTDGMTFVSVPPATYFLSSHA